MTTIEQIKDMTQQLHDTIDKFIDSDGGALSDEVFDSLVDLLESQAEFLGIECEDDSPE